MSLGVATYGSQRFVVLCPAPVEFGVVALASGSPLVLDAVTAEAPGTTFAGAVSSPRSSPLPAVVFGRPSSSRVVASPLNLAWARALRRTLSSR